MPLTAAQTEAACDDLSQNPSTTADGQIIHITLRMKNVVFNAGAFYDALNAAYPTVASDKDALSHNELEFVISP